MLAIAFQPGNLVIRSIKKRLITYSQLLLQSLFQIWWLYLNVASVFVLELIFADIFEPLFLPHLSSVHFGLPHPIQTASRAVSSLAKGLPNEGSCNGQQLSDIHIPMGAPKR
jgi:hypothetical protein